MRGRDPSPGVSTVPGDIVQDSLPRPWTPSSRTEAVRAAIRSETGRSPWATAI